MNTQPFENALLLADRFLNIANTESGSSQK